MIGLLDCDWSLSTSNTFLIPNIEIMKLASYYKKNKNHFCRLLTFDDTDLKSYEKIYIFSELHSNLKLPDHFLRQDNIIFGERSNGKTYAVLNYCLKNYFEKGEKGKEGI